MTSSILLEIFDDGRSRELRVVILTDVLLRARILLLTTCMTTFHVSESACNVINTTCVIY